MPVLKCKMCGGSLSVQEGQTICVCDYCGTKQTLPKLDNEKKITLYERASYYRRNNEFDKASLIYEELLNEDNTDAESYWSLVLCKYGVEYVEDPFSHKRIPTVNRTQQFPVFSDPDYQEAIKHASPEQRIMYEMEAAAIDEIQKNILNISSKEEPFDIFICYKETDNNGRRTLDSVLAQDIYNELTNHGYKVFFSRITLEDKIGTAYEPYIYAALKSAKIMIVVGTSKENFNAIWVKNEWSRFLSFIRNGERKILISAYRDMNPYDLPEEFAYLQGQDMSKLGYIQDLIRGIDKIIGNDKPESSQVVGREVVKKDNVELLLKRANRFLEDGDFASADYYYNKALDENPECSEAYLGKLLAANECRSIHEMRKCVDEMIFDCNDDDGSDEESEFSIVNDMVYCNQEEVYKIPEIEPNHIDMIMDKYGEEDFISLQDMLSKYWYTFKEKVNINSSQESRMRIYDRIDADNLYSRALEYSDSSTKKKLEFITENIDSKSKNDLQLLLNKHISDYIEFVKETDNKIEKEYQKYLSDKENRYQACIDDLKQKDLSKKKLSSIRSQLKSLGEYKDVSFYLEQCDDLLKKKRGISNILPFRKSK